MDRTAFAPGLPWTLAAFSLQRTQVVSLSDFEMTKYQSPARKLFLPSSTPEVHVLTDPFLSETNVAFRHGTFELPQLPGCTYVPPICLEIPGPCEGSTIASRELLP